MHCRILDVESRHHPHQIIALEVLDLGELVGKSSDFSIGVVHFRFLLNHHAVDRRLRILGPFWIKVDNVLIVANPRHFSGRVFDPLLLFANLFVHHRDGAIENFLFFLHPAVLINADDLVRDIGCQLRIGIEDADLEEVGVPDFIDVEFMAQDLVSGLSRRLATIAAPFFLEL